MSDSVRPHGLQPTRLLHPWDSPGKRTGVGATAFSDTTLRVTTNGHFPMNRTGKPGVLQSTGSQEVGCDRVAEQQHHELFKDVGRKSLHALLPLTRASIFSSFAWIWPTLCFFWKPCTHRVYTHCRLNYSPPWCHKAHKLGMNVWCGES